MVIVFYNAEEDCLYISSEREPMHKVSLDNDPLSSIPNDDILYVQKGCYVTKSQIGQWLDGTVELDENEEPSRYTGLMDTSSPEGIPVTVSDSKQRYIHPMHNGTVLIEDISTPEYPDGVVLHGKWNFIPIDKIGKHVLEDSPFYRALLKNKKIEVVSHEYVMKNMHKQHTKVSPHERALDAILIKDSRRGAAETVANEGGMSTPNSSDPIEFEVGF